MLSQPRRFVDKPQIRSRKVEYTIETNFQHKFVWIVLVPTAVILGLIFYPFLGPLALATICAFATNQVKNTMRSMGRRHRTAYRVLLSTIVVLGFSIMAHAMRRIYSLTLGEEKEAASGILKESTSALKDHIVSFTAAIQQTTESLGMKSSKSVAANVEKYAQDGAALLTKFAANFVVDLPEMVLSIVIFFVCYFFIISKEHVIMPKLRALFSIKKNEFNSVIEAAHDASYSAIITNMVTGFFQALVLTTGSVIAGIHEWSVVFFLSFISAMLPVVGTLPVSAALLMYSYYFMSNQAAIIILVAGICASLIDNLVRPIILAKNQNDLNSFIAFLGVIGAVMMFGFTGFFLGPFVLVFFSKLLPLVGRNGDSDIAH